jgi:hypothetical protein
MLEGIDIDITVNDRCFFDIQNNYKTSLSILTPGRFCYPYLKLLKSQHLSLRLLALCNNGRLTNKRWKHHKHHKHNI